MSNFINGLKKFQVIPRELVFDNSLSDRARFVYCFMASKPDGWDFLLNPMAKELGYSVETLRKYINELIDGGWLKKGEQNNDGKFGAVVYTLLSTKNADTEKNRNKEIPTRKNTDTEKFRHGEKPAQDNKDNKESIEKKDLPKKERKDKSFPKKKAKFDVYADLSYVDAAYADIWKEWLEYKDAINKQYKAQQGAEGQYKSLLKYADNNPVLANAIVKRSIERSWQGVFELSDKEKALYLSERSPYYITNTSTNTLPKGWTQERYDMYIRNGYTITEDGRLFKDGKEYK